MTAKIPSQFNLTHFQPGVNPSHWEIKIRSEIPASNLYKPEVFTFIKTEFQKNLNKPMRSNVDVCLNHPYGLAHHLNYQIQISDSPRLIKYLDFEMKRVTNTNELNLLNLPVVEHFV